MSSHKHGHNADDGKSESSAYETRDIKVRPLVVFIAGLTVVGIATYLVVYVIIGLFSAQAEQQDARLQPVAGQAKPLAPGEERLPPEPRIQANPAADLKSLLDEEAAVLTTYGWVDRPAGVVRVPIDVAMRKVLEQGLPVRQPGDTQPATGAPASGTKPQGAADTPKASK
jgi:hypothetical protein